MSDIDINDFEDFTCRPCPLGSAPRHYGDNDEYIDNDMPMYSFERAANNYWNGVCNYLRSRGCTDAEIAETLAHKHMRWMLDNHDDDIALLGYQTAKDYFNNAKPKA